MELPKIHTQEIQDKQDVEKWENGSERDRLLLMLRAFSSSRSLPTTDDYAKVQQDATYDFRRNDYGEAQQYVDTLTELVEFYKDLAENYLDVLNDYAISVDEHGSVTNYPFVLTEDGYDRIGRVEVLALEEHDPDSLWNGYIEPFLKFATEWERGWIFKTFPEQVAELSQE